MNFIKFKFIFLLFLIKFSAVKSYYDNQPKFTTQNGHLNIESAQNRDVQVKIIGTGQFKVNDVNVLSMINSLKNVSSNLSQYRSVNARLNSLTTRVNSVSGLNMRVARLEQRMNSMNSTNNTSPRPNPRDLSQLRVRVRNLERKVDEIMNKLEEDNCRSSPCLNGGTCIDGYDRFFCQCTKNWQGDTCSIDVNECYVESPCQNGGTCINSPGSYLCVCPQNFVGIHCSLPKVDCATAPAELCGHGYCVNRNTNIGYECICEPGWTKNNPVTGAPQCVVDINECETDMPHCSKDPPVTCRNLDGTYMCGPCPAGYTGNGHYCIDINECEINNGGCSTAPTVTCHNTRGSYYCDKCPLGFQGDGRICLRSNACDGFTSCHPLARCVEYSSGVSCLCPAGYTGNGYGPNGCITYQVDACNPNPCQNGGTCMKYENSTSFCICPSGTSQPNCERTIDPCTPNPCQNGGQCTLNARGQRKCVCITGFTGNLCQNQRTKCGPNFLNSASGVLKYPLDGSPKYQSGDRCAWVIKTNITHVLNITFESFNLESSNECRFDWLQIHDGRSTQFPLIGRFCGSELPNGGNIISTHNMLYFWFRSDNSTEHDGFQLKWESILPSCGSTLITTSHGTVASPGSPGNYPINRDCYWYIKAPEGKRITLTFYTIQIENHSDCNHDKIEIYSGMSASPLASDLIERFCNRSNPIPLTTPSNSLTIYFHSDGEGSDSGFQIHYSVVEGFPGCGGVFTSLRGEFGSPVVDGTYPHNLECDYLIRLPVDSKIDLKFIQFNIESHSSCRLDNLLIYDGPNDESPLINRYCGDTLPSDIRSRSNTLFLKFKSDWSVSYGGFRIKYLQACGGNYQLDSGNITSPNYPRPYEHVSNCDYFIEAPMGKAIILQFTDFDLEPTPSRTCDYDFVEIYDGIKSNSTLVGRYCGEQIPETLVSSSNFIHLIFISDISMGGRGFLANYSFIESKCGGVLRNSEGTIRPPTDPDIGGYLHSARCNWIIYAPSDKVIQLQFTTFDLEESSSCEYDYVEVFDNSTKHGGSMGKFCGNQSPPTITSSENIVTITFVSDSSRTSAGFVASYIFLDARDMCGGNYFSEFGYIRSPGWPEKYLPSKTCEWILTVPVGKQIVLYPKTFEVEQEFDFLEIRNGGSSKSPLLGSFSGTTIPNSIKSFSNRLYLKFVTDLSRELKGFEIEYDGSATGCGSILTTPRGELSSPNYPESYPSNMVCVWNINTNLGSRIELIITELNLEESSGCFFDYVEIYDGKDNISPLIGKYCSPNDHPLQLVSSSNHLYIRMKTDATGNGPGFNMRYRALCTLTLTNPYGVIESPNYPNLYGNDLQCEWTIQAPLGNRIYIEFTEIDLEFSEYSKSKPCQYDEIIISEIIDDTKTNPVTFCNTVKNYTSSKNIVSIVFRTDVSGSGRGFQLEYQTIGCGGMLIKPEGAFSTPNYPNFYPKNTHCNWTIIADYGYSVELTIHGYDLEGLADCTFDGLVVSNYPNETNYITKLCRSNPNDTIITGSGHELYVSFYSDSSATHKGFNASYKFVLSKYGGKITAQSGFIMSPNYPKEYPHNIDVEWLIEVQNNHLIEFYMMDFSIEDSSSCMHDKLTIYDGDEKLNHRKILEHCGENLPAIRKHTTTTNQLLINFQTDSSVSSKGFKMNYTTACGAIIFVNDSGIIELSALPRSAGNCTWYLRATDPTKRITFNLLHFSGFDSTTNVDIKDDEPRCFRSLEVFDGDDLESARILKFCGERENVKTVQSSGQFLTVAILHSFFISFETIRFKAMYSIFDTACGGDIHSIHGSIASPNYPNSYPLNTECVWNIIASPGNRITLSINEIAIPKTDDFCNQDYLEIREMSESGSIIGIYCGNNPETNLTSSSGLYIKFRSGNVVVGKGFKLEYAYESHNEITGSEGVITTPLYPHIFYDGQFSFSWRITVPFGNIISFKFTEFHIDYNDPCINELSIYDGYDDTANLLTEEPLCGYQDDSTKKSTSNVLFLKLSAKYTYSGSKFYMKWEQLEKVKPDDIPEYDKDFEKKCGGNRTTIITDFKKINFTSPGYPNGYDNSLNCSWIYTTNRTGYHPFIHFENIDLEVSENCYADYVRVGNTTDLLNWNYYPKLCTYTELLPTYYQGDPYLILNFRSNYNGNKTGYTGYVGIDCGSALEGPNGVITMNSGNVYRYFGRPNNCVWRIKVKPGSKIKFTFDKFLITNLKTPDPACANAIIFKNGYEETSPVLGDGRYCGSDIPTIPTTFSNYAYIKFVHNYNREHEFVLRYEEENDICDQSIILTNEYNSTLISTPSVLHSFTECTWTVSVPSGKYLKVEYIKFNLKFEKDCQSEFLEISTGTTAFAPVYSRECGFKFPNTKLIKHNVIKIKYATTIEDPNPGFTIKVSLFGCGAIYNAPVGEITSPNYPTYDGYQPNLDCEYHIMGKQGSYVNLTFINLDLPGESSNCTSDYIEIFSFSTFDDNCNCTNNQSLAKVCGDKEPSQSIISYTNLVVIKFKTFNVRSSSMGWKLTYNSSTEKCGGKLNTETGTITTPGYPEAQQHWRTCLWVITVPKGRRIILNVEKFELSPNALQFAAIYNDESMKSRIITLRGTINNQNIKSSDNVMAVRFVSRAETNHQGFKLTYTSNESSICDVDINQQEGTLKNLLNTSSYSCTYRRTAPLINDDPNIGTIAFTITNYVSQFSSSTECTYALSSISFFYGDRKEFGSICNNITEDVFYAMPYRDSGLTFKQSSFGRALIFNINYKIHRCGGILNNEFGNIILQPSFSENYGGFDCAWNVKYEKTELVEFNLTQLDFKLPCDEEYLIIYQGNSIRHPKIARYCGQLTKPSFFISQKSKLYIQYHSKNFNKDSKLQFQVNRSSSACGGILHNRDKILKSPKISANQTQYPNNVECIWEITAEPGFHIGLQFFGRFNIENSPNCTKDYIEVYSYEHNDWSMIGSRICGREIPSIINSTATKMKVLFHSDESVNGDGFSAIWNGNCGGVFETTDSLQYITSPRYPNSYPNKTVCNYTLTAPEGKFIEIKFLDFKLERRTRGCQYDNVTLYKINEYYYPKQLIASGTYCGDVAPKDMLTQEVAVVLFTSDAYIESKGFKFSYQLKQCGGAITEPQDISSPINDETGTHPENLRCYWNITAPEDKHIVIQVDMVELEHSPQCYYDFLEIYSGKTSEQENRKAKVCGNLTAFSVNINEKNALIYFHTDSGNNYRGFKGSVRFITNCENKIQLTRETPRYTLDKISSEYNNLQDCYYLIKSPHDTVIKAHFEQFHIAPCSGNNNSAIVNKSNCSCDFIEVRDGISTFNDLIGTYCGHNAPNDIISSGSSLWMRFSTDGFIQSTGFKVIFEMTESPCGKKLYNLTENNHIIIKSPGDGNYLPNLRCAWAITAPSTKSIELEFETFELQDIGDYETCSNDVLEVVESNKIGIISEGLGETVIYSGTQRHSDVSFWSGLRSPNTHVQFCGAEKPSHYISEHNEIILNFVTDSNIEKSGFRIRANIADNCVRNYTGVQGRIKKDIDTDCSFYIIAPENHTLSIYFMQIYFIETNCNKSSISIYENNPNGKLLGSFCGYNLPDPVFTEVSQLYFKVKKAEKASDYPYGMPTNFDFYYIASKNGVGCGGEIYNFAGSFSSPYYPENHRNFSDCRWIIRVPQNKNVAIRFPNFDLGSSASCENNFVEIIEVSLTGEESVERKLCGDDLPDPYLGSRNVLIVRFRKTVNFEGNGFRAEFISASEDSNLMNY